MRCLQVRARTGDESQRESGVSRLCGRNATEGALLNSFCRVPGRPVDPRFLASFQVSSLPNFVTSLSLRNVGGGVVVSRGSVRIPAEGENTFRLNVSKTPHLVRDTAGTNNGRENIYRFLFSQELSEKSLTLLGPASTLHVTLEEIENVNVSSKAVSAQKPGTGRRQRSFVSPRSRYQL